MPEDISPEEKLLNLIKNNTEPQAPRLEEKESLPESPFRPQKKIKTKKPAPAVSRQNEKEPKRPFSFLNRFLILILFGLAVFMVIGYVSPYKPKRDIKGGIAVYEEEPKERVTISLPPADNYTGAMSQRQIFKMYEPPVVQPVGPPKPRVTLQQLLAGYAFIGIIFGEPSQAIIEERRSGQSYYLTEGQYIGEIKIEKIDRGKITVKYEDEVMDIRI